MSAPCTPCPLRAVPTAARSRLSPTRGSSRNASTTWRRSPSVTAGAATRRWPPSASRPTRSSMRARPLASSPKSYGTELLLRLGLRFLLGGWRVLRLLDLGVDVDVVGDEHAAALQGLVPRQAPVGPFHLADGARRVDGGAPRRLDAVGVEGDVQGDRLGHAVHGEIAADLVLVAAGLRDLRRLEGDLRALLRVEEVGALEVGVALLVARVDARHFGLEVDGAPGRVVLVPLQRRGDLAELAAHRGDHH